MKNFLPFNLSQKATRRCTLPNPGNRLPNTKKDKWNSQIIKGHTLGRKPYTWPREESNPLRLTQRLTVTDNYRRDTEKQTKII